MNPKEKALRQAIFDEISANMKAALENCACLGRTALNKGPSPMTSTYVDRMHGMIERNIIEGPK